MDTVSCWVATRNVAVIAWTSVIGTTHVRFDPHAAGTVPPQPPNVAFEPACTAAVSVTFDPSENAEEQSAPQLIPAGLLVTVPDCAAGPCLITVSGSPGFASKFALTVTSVSTWT
jgi:hypothetical protein